MACSPLAIWLYLLLGRGGFWLARERDDRDEPPSPARWPRVTAVVPARNEADVIAQSIGSLLAQDYPGPFRVILVDDAATTAPPTRRCTAAATGAEHGCDVMRGAPAAGRLDRQAVGPAPGRRGTPAHRTTPDYLLLTDADIGHAPDNLRRLVARAESERPGAGLLMVELSLPDAGPSGS